MKLRAILMASAVILTLDFPVFAGPRDDILDAFAKCGAIGDDKSRLACYDSLKPRLQDAMGTPPAALDHPPTPDEQKSWFGFDIGGLFGPSVAPAQQNTPEKFGSENVPAPPPPQPEPGAPPPPPPPQAVDSIEAGVTDYSFTPFGKFIVFLDNGQVWRQIEGDSERAHFGKTPKDNRVTIERGLLGSYNLLINGSVKTYKVTRVK